LITVKGDEVNVFIFLKIVIGPKILPLMLIFQLNFFCLGNIVNNISFISIVPFL
jgi:hypothetical protein